jgi:hypothetical protein
MSGQPKMTIWSEPVSVRRKYYPTRRLALWIWRLLGLAVVAGLLLVHMAFPTNERGGIWVTLGFGLACGGAFAFGLPAMIGIMGSTVGIGESAIERHNAPVAPFFLLAAIYGLYVWRWEAIRKLRLIEEVIDGKLQRVLWVLDNRGDVLGCVGLARSVKEDSIEAWAQHKHCSFERPSSAKGG